MTPHQQKALIAYRDRGVPLSWDTRRLLIRDGHLSDDGVIITTRPEDIDTRTQGDRIVELFQDGKTVKQVAAALGITVDQVYNARKRLEITGGPTKPFNLKAAMKKSDIAIGSFSDFLAASPDIEAVFALATRERVTMFEAAGRLLQRDTQPHPVFRRSLRL